MAKAYSVASWNVEHFKGDVTRTSRVIGFIKQQNPDVIGVYEVEGSAVFAEVTAVPRRFCLKDDMACQPGYRRKGQR